MNDKLSDKYDQALQHQRKKESDKARALLEEILAEDPKFEDAYEVLSILLHDKGQFKEAVQIINKWIEVNPDAIMAHANLSRCYMALEDIPAAEKALAESRRLSWKQELSSSPNQPQNPEQDLFAKIEKYQKIIEFDPGDVLGYYSLGCVYRDLQQFSEAEKTFREGLDKDPNHSSSYFELGACLEKMGKKDTAKEIYSKGIIIADKNGDMVPLKKMESRLAQI